MISAVTPKGALPRLVEDPHAELNDPVAADPDVVMVAAEPPTDLDAVPGSKQ